jgi:CheY-like chemotaxis protein
MTRDQLTSCLEKLKGKHILVVEDQALFADILLRLTKQHGIRLSHAESGNKAIKAIEENTPDVILLDLLLPDMDGLEFAQFVRRNENTKSVPIIAMSGEPRRRESSLQNGCNAFIQKPFRLPELFSQIRPRTLQRVQGSHQSTDHKLQKRIEDDAN